MKEYGLNNQFDALDLRILGELTVNARIAFSKLADKLNVSNSLVHQRVKKMEEIGVLKNPIYRLDPETLGYDTCAFTQIMLTNSRFMQPVLDELKKIPEIVECVNIAGRFAIMVKIYTVNNTHLRDVVYEKIQLIKGVEGTNTVVSFETAFLRGVPLEI